jgi:hypothetical protein
MEYYIAVNGQQQGPFTVEELAGKGITPSTLVWAQGMTDWTIASKVEELKPLFVTQVPPIPSAPQQQFAQQPQYTQQPQYQPPYGEAQQPEKKKSGSKAVIAIIIAAVILLIFIVTCPGRKAHEEAVVNVTKSFLSSQVDNGSGGILSAITNEFMKGIGDKAVETYVDNNLEVHNYFIFSVGELHFGTTSKNVSYGILGHVFTVDVETLTSKFKHSIESKVSGSDIPDVDEVAPVNEDTASTPVVTVPATKSSDATDATQDDGGNSDNSSDNSQQAE